MIQKSLVSVIIPCYNAQCYIESCVSSLFTQTYSHWEAILVDDGSTDLTLELLEKVCLRDMRIKIHTQQNMGVAKARDNAINYAQGEFYVFLDVDDSLEPDALKSIIDAFKSEDVDVVRTGMNLVRDNKVISSRLYRDTTYLPIDYLKEILIGNKGWEIWGGGYRASLFTKPIEHPVGLKIGEDAVVLIQLICRARKIRTITSKSYNYIQYPVSASHVRNSSYAEEALRAPLFIDNILRKQTFYSEVASEISSMFLLFYSNSNRKKHLSSNHPMVKNIMYNHLRISSIMRIPLRKAMYVLYCFLVGTFVSGNADNSLLDEKRLRC